MLTRSLAVAVAAAVLVPVAAAADPVTIGVHSLEGGASASLSSGALTGTPYDMGSVTLRAEGDAVNIAVEGLAGRRNHQVELTIMGGGNWNTLRAELLDPLGGVNNGSDALDVMPYHDGVPAGYSTSNTNDGFSFAQSAGLQRSATFVGGGGSVMADEESDGADALLFTGLAGASGAIRVTFGLRDFHGGRDFLIRLSAEDGMAATPEPASMLLIGTGLAGLAAVRRRRRAQELARS